MGGSPIRSHLSTQLPKSTVGGVLSSESVSGKHVLVVGLGRTGLAASRFLKKKGAHVTVSDSRPPAYFQKLIGGLVSSNIGLEMGQHDESIFCRQDLIVISPGVDPRLPVLEAARSRNIPVVSEIEVASWFLSGRIVGITGSNGKTTTTSLLSKILTASNFSVQAGGNFGTPLISQLESSSEKTLSVVELSSFQLEIIKQFRPHLAILLNLTEDHLDRHGSFEEYVAAKGNIFKNQGPEDCAVLNADEPLVMKFVKTLRSRPVLFSRGRELVEGVFIENKKVIYRTGNLERVIISLEDIPLLGQHNLENVLAAIAAAGSIGADLKVIPKVIADFKGMEHRLEFVRELGGVKFYNDSKATNVDAAAKSIGAFDGGVLLILGGKEKGGGFSGLRGHIKEKVKSVFLVGSAAKRIGAEIHGVTNIVQCKEVPNAVRLAFKEAKPEDTVLLAPACASFDQFENFEHRGRVFKETVLKLTCSRESTAPSLDSSGKPKTDQGVLPLEKASHPEVKPQEQDNPPLSSLPLPGSVGRAFKPRKKTKKR